MEQTPAMQWMAAQLAEAMADQYQPRIEFWQAAIERQKKAEDAKAE